MTLKELNLTEEQVSIINKMDNNIPLTEHEQEQFKVIQELAKEDLIKNIPEDTLQDLTELIPPDKSQDYYTGLVYGLVLISSLLDNLPVANINFMSDKELTKNKKYIDFDDFKLATYIVVFLSMLGTEHLPQSDKE